MFAQASDKPQTLSPIYATTRTVRVISYRQVEVDNLIQSSDVTTATKKLPRLNSISNLMRESLDILVVKIPRWM